MRIEDILALDIMKTPPPAPNARLQYGDDPEQYGDLRFPERGAPYPVVIVVHGGAWTSRFTLDHMGHLAAALAAEGLATWTIEFRRVGSDGGIWPATLLDVGVAVDHLRKLAEAFPLDLNRASILGHSSGGHLALWAAARPKVDEGSELYMPDPLPMKSVVSIAGIPDLEMDWRASEEKRIKVERLVGGPLTDVPDRYAAGSPSHYLPLGLPQVMVHGTEDDSVPFEFSRWYASAAQDRGDNVTLVALPGAGHFEPIDPKSNEWPTVREIILEQSRG